MQALRAWVGRNVVQPVAEPLLGTEMDPTMLARALPELGVNPAIGHAAELAAPALEQAGINAGAGRAASGTPGSQQGVIRLPGDMLTPEVASSRADMLARGLLDDNQLRPHVQGALRKWIQTKAGTEADPLRGVPIQGHEWPVPAIGPDLKSMYNRQSLPQETSDTWGAFGERALTEGNWPAQYPSIHNPDGALYRRPTSASFGIPPEKFHGVVENMPPGGVLYQHPTVNNANLLEPMQSALNTMQARLANVPDAHLAQMGFPDMVKLSNQNYADSLKQMLRSAGEPVRTYDNGMQWRKMTPEQVKFEGQRSRMANCLGDYCDDAQNGSKSFYGLYDANNQPKVVMHTNEADQTLGQIKGKANSTPHAYSSQVGDLLDTHLAGYDRDASPDYPKLFPSEHDWMTGD